MRKIKLTLFAGLFLMNATIVFGQSITFKKVYPDVVGIGPNDFNVDCKPLTNNTYIIKTRGMLLLKINQFGDIFSQINYLNFGTFTHFIFNSNNRKLTFLSNNTLSNSYGKKILQLDTSLNFINQVQYDSINYSYWSIDRNILIPAFNNCFLLSANKGNLYTPGIIKTDSIGNIIWSKYYSSISGGIQDFIQTSDSGFVLAANLRNLGASVIKTDSIGNVLWAKSYFRPSGYIHNVLKNVDGTMIITGNIDSSLTYSPLFFLKLSQSGNVIWSKTYGNFTNNIKCYASNTRHTKDGGYITLATLERNHNDLLLIKTDSNGDTLWVRAHGSPKSMEYGQSIEQLNDKGFIFTGITNNNIPVPLSSLYVVRTDSLGRTDSLCEEYSVPIAINNITVNDSNISVTSVPFTVHTSTANTSTQSFVTYAYDGCYLDAIPELYAEQIAPLLIYPNPNEGKFTIENKTNIPLKTEIEIYNINSKKIYSGFTMDTSVEFDLSGFSKGLYFVKVSNERWVKTGKVMVE